MATQKNYKRRQFYIKKDYQFQFIFKFCLLMLTGALVSTGLLFLFSRGTLTSSFEQSRLVVKSTSFAILPHILWTNLLTLILITLATIVVVLFVSHKIAGPMFRFEKDLKQIGKGDLTVVIHLREKDQILEMANSLNEMTTSLRGKVQALESEVEAVLELAVQRDACEEIAQKLEHVYYSIRKHFII